MPPTATLSIRQHDPVNRLYRIILRLKQPDLEVEANMIVPTLPRGNASTALRATSVRRATESYAPTQEQSQR